MTAEAVTDPGKILSAPLSGKAVDVALAEFNALRGEIMIRIRLISVIGNYIREKLWPYLQEQVGMLYSWEAEVAARSRRREVIAFIFLGAPMAFLFILASVLSLLIVGAGADPLLLAGAWLATLIAILIPVSLNTVILIRHRRARVRE